MFDRMQCYVPKAPVETVSTFLLASLNEDSEQSISLMCLMQMQSCNIQQKINYLIQKMREPKKKTNYLLNFMEFPLIDLKHGRTAFASSSDIVTPKKTLLKIKLCIYESNF